MQEVAMTVLMPVFNAEKYLRTAIESVLTQTFENFELLIVDDASSDTSVEIIKSYSDKRIILVHNDNNLGIAATLNKGIQLSKTELIARMDADDICYPQRLEKQYVFLQENEDCALLSAAVEVIADNGDFIRIDKYDPKYFYYNLNFICWIYHPSVVYRKSAVIAAGMYTETYSEDFDLWWKMARQFRISHLPEILLQYRISASSLSAVVRKEEYESSQHRQVVRNIHFYTGLDFFMTYSEVEALRFNFQPLLNENSSNQFISFLKKLRIISKCIEEKKNINLHKKHVKAAYRYKRDFSINLFSVHLNASARFWLFLRLGNIRKCFQLVFKNIFTGKP